jgi:hypothetical protein
MSEEQPKQQEQDNEDMPVYKLKVKGNETKALDMWALREWILLRERMSSIMNINISALPENTKMDTIQAKIYQDAWVELKSFIDVSLGLIKPEEKVEEVEEPEVVVEEPPKRQPVKQQDTKPNGAFFQKQQSPPTPEDEDDDMITL